MKRLHNKKEQKSNRNYLRNHATSAEAILWTMLSARKIDNLKFRRQHSVGNYILDFYCPELKLAIELDGAPHLTYAGNENDLKRDEFLKSKGINVIRFENQVVFNHPNDIKDTIREFKKRQLDF